jgi:hypothetical protein
MNKGHDSPSYKHKKSLMTNPIQYNFSYLTDLSHQDSSITPSFLSMQCAPVLHPPRNELYVSCFSHLLLPSWLCALYYYMDSKCLLFQIILSFLCQSPSHTNAHKRTDVPLYKPTHPNEPCAHEPSRLFGLNFDIMVATGDINLHV